MKCRICGFESDKEDDFAEGVWCNTCLDDDMNIIIIDDIYCTITKRKG